MMENSQKIAPAREESASIEVGYPKAKEAKESLEKLKEKLRELKEIKNPEKNQVELIKTLEDQIRIKEKANIEHIEDLREKDLYSKAFPVETKRVNGTEKTIQTVQKSYLTEYIKLKHPHIKIFNELRKYDNGYYKKWDCASDIYAEMPPNLKNNRDAEEVQKNLMLEKDSIKFEKDLARNSERYIIFKNGVYDLEAKKLLPHDKNKIFLNQIPYNYEDDPEYCELTERYLIDTCAGDEDLRKLLLQIIGVVMSDIRSNKSWFYFYGKKDTGKSTILKIIRELLTDPDGTIHYTSLGLKVLQDDSGSNKELHPILTSKANIDMDCSTKEMIKDTAQLKKLTSGGDSITCHKKFAVEPVSGISKAMLLFAGNGEPPRVAGRSADNDKKAFLDRMIPVEFTTVIPKSEQVENLEKKISYSYLIYLAISELHDFRYNNNTFTETESVRSKRQEMIDEADEVGRFIKERLVVCETDGGEKPFLPYSEIYAAYEEWLKDDGLLREDENLKMKPDTLTREIKSKLGLTGTNHRKRVKGKSYAVPVLLNYDFKPAFE